MISRSAGRGDGRRGVTYYKRDFWETENLKYAEVHFRMAKVAWLVRRLAGARECDLLDLGCGPGTLGHLVPGNVHYHGIDIAIQEPAPNLIEMDILQSPVSFHDMKFDLVVAQGLFEYCGDHQARKFAEIRNLLKDDGKFLVTYMNFAHRKREVYWPYSNVQQPADFRRDLERYFVVERSFPGEYNWNFTTPNRTIMKVVQAHLTVDIPIFNSLLGINRFYICSARSTVHESVGGAAAS
jgi:cyclopropane fatty-acyl-phospholipid synthase-like methyltransferase